MCIEERKFFSVCFLRVLAQACVDVKRYGIFAVEAIRGLIPQSSPHGGTVRGLGRVYF